MSSVLLRDFVLQIAICSERAACIARYIRFMHSDFNSIIQEKQLDENHQHLDADYKTLADVIIQEVIKRDLYPKLDQRIFGEEDGSLKLQSSAEKIIIDVTGTDEDIVTLLKQLFNNKSSRSIETLANIISSSFDITLPEHYQHSLRRIPEDFSIDLSNIGIWIDPVDGTQQYINGTDGIIDPHTGITIDGLPTALVLIGCFDIRHGNAIIGVINRAFHQRIDAFKWKSLIYWGTALPDGKFNNLDDVCKETRNNDKQVLLHGSVNTSNKLLAIALKQANVFLVTKAAAYNWDLCAAHAIILSVNGQILDLRQTLDFYKQNQSLMNLNLTAFPIVYNKKISSSHFNPKDYACAPFIAYHNQQDLVDILQLLASDSIAFD
ncbi:unnamed protein product [Adineta ricciae]|uniref:inositol-1,4-bisphosphate 1-phosphatase n=1 Tax=Adineta ricciae TaxID=249248 RepID=A0A815BBT5_ADIRI|nr:unnamed protein product [Adineta ricciae]